MLLSRFTFVIFFAALCGCSTKIDRAALSTSITQNGDASIEMFHTGSGWGVKGVIEATFRIYGIDGVFPSKPGSHGVFPISPGTHEIKISAQFKREAWHAYIDDGGDIVPFTALAGLRYRVNGRELDPTTGEVWIEEVATSREVSSRARISLNPNQLDHPENELLIVPIPKHL